MSSGTTSSPLYASRRRIYPRAVAGTWRRIKWVVLVACLALYYGGAWLRWDRGPGAPNQALLIDMSGPRAYFFDLEIWPQEVYYLTGLLILAAIGLFLATSLFGRSGCGYACPQTVWTDLFMLAERWIEGDRNARIRRDKGPATAGKVLRKGAKHAIWLLIAVATGRRVGAVFQRRPDRVASILRRKRRCRRLFLRPRADRDNLSAGGLGA